MTSDLFTIRALLEASAACNPDRVAVSDGVASITFAELHDAALRSGTALRRLGVRRGDRIGICMEKGIEQAIAILGSLVADAIVVPVLPTLKSINIEHIVRNSEMRLMITDEVRSPQVIGAAPDIPLLIADGAPAASERSLRALREAETPEPVPTSSIGADPAMIIYSSGSTGRPKGIVVSHRNLYDGARITVGYLGTQADDSIAGVLPLNFDYGLNQLWQCLLTGARLALHTLMFPADLFRFLREEEITVLPVMPVIVTLMFDRRLSRSQPEEPLASVRYISSSGGPVSSRMLSDLRATFPEADVYLMYGLTEAFRSTYLPPEELGRRPMSIGRAIPDVEILVLDDELRPVPPGVPGELVHRGGCVAKGYWNDSVATACRFRQLEQYPGETVVFSGDIVTADEDGYLYFKGRRDSMIKTSGFRVSPTEVEDVAVRFPGVEACVAFGVPHPAIGEDIVLAYASSAPVDRPAFERYLKASLPPHMVPHHLVTSDRFPSTGNQGKIDRQQVIEAARVRLGVAVDATLPS